MRFTRKADKRLPAAERREIIIDAATQTFMESGYHGAHMDAIAEEADVTKPILYRHFPSKLSLLLAILDRAGDELRNSLLENRDEGLDWRESIEHDIASYLDFVNNFGAGYSLIYRIGLSVDREVAEHMSRIRDINREIVGERIRSYTDTGSVSPGDINMITVLIVGMAEAAAIYWMNNEKLTREVCEKNLVQAVMNILACLPPRDRRRSE